MIMDNYEIFLKVVETGNITRAAQILNYTQSGVSHAIASLEKEMGFTLFTRSKSGVSLTENAAEILPEIRRIVNMKAGLKEKCFAINHEVKGVLRLAVSTSIITQHIPSLVRDFRDMYSDVEIELINGTYDEICDALRDGRAGIGFLPEPYCLEFDRIPFIKDRMVAVFDKGNPLAEKDSVTLREVAACPLISQFKGCEGLMDTILGPFRSDADIRYNFYEDSAMLSLVEEGLGAGFIMDCALDKFSYDIKAVPLSPEIYRVVYCVTRKDEPVTHLTRVFRDFAVSRGNV